MRTTSATTPSSRRNTSPILSHRDEFVRQAVLDAFGHRGRWVLDEPDFIDRKPDCAAKKHISEVGRDKAIASADVLGRAAA